MSSATGPEQLDVAELAATLLAEVRSGIAARVEVVGSHLDVVEARVRVGEPARARDAASGTDASGGATTGTGPGEPSASSVLTPPGLVEAGWQVELVLRREDLRPGWSGSTSSDAAAGWSPTPPVTAVGMWRDRSTTDLKGVDRVRARQLADHRIHTIGELLDLDEDGIARVVASTRASRLLEVWVRAALLATPVPVLPASPVDGRPLAWLAARAPALLRDDLGASRVSRTAATGLFDLLAAWSTSLDRAALGTVTLAELRAAARPR